MNGRRTAWVLAGLCLLLGLTHLGFAVAAPRWAPDVAWFVGAGLAFLLAPLLGAASLRHPDDRLLRGLAVGSALALAVYAAAVWSVLPQPQVMLAGVLFLGLAAAVASARRRAP